MVNPTSDLGLLEDQRMGFHEFHLFLDRLIKVREFQELDGVCGCGNFLCVPCLCGSLEFLPKLSGRERLHSTVGMVEYGDLARPQQPLGDDQRSDRVFSACNRRINPRSHSIRFLDRWNLDSRGTTGISDDVSITFLEPELTHDAVICFSFESAVQSLRSILSCPLTRYEHPCKSLGGQVSLKACRPLPQGGFMPRCKRTYCEVLGRGNCQLPFILETGHIGQIALLKVSVRVGGHDLWSWRRRCGRLACLPFN
jgi:hypothetical protein